MRTQYAPCLAIAMMALVTSTAPADLAITWSSVDGGGWMSSNGGAFRLSGTIGQPDAGSFSDPLAGADFRLVGGFWVIAMPAPLVGDLDGNHDVDDSDLGILLNDYGCNAGPGLCPGDVDGDGDTDDSDLGLLLNHWND